MLILIIGLIILAGIAMTVGVLHNRQIQKKIESGEVKICSVSCALVSIEGMISTSAMSELIFRPIMELSAQKSKGNAEQVFDFLTKESLLAAVSKKIEYYDDEELDRFRGRPSNGYNEEEVEEFREIMYTCKEDEVAGWRRSLQLRGIELPDELKDELFLIVGERRFK